MIILGAALVSLISIAVGIYIYLRRSLPQVEGVVRVLGLRDSIEIVRDQDAIPHIYAHDRLDALFGLGYVHAQDRLWQMEYQRRIGKGQLSEIFGQKTVQEDRFQRTLGVYRAAVASWKALSPEVKEAIEAYMAGINAFIQACPKSKLAPEFSFFSVKPQLWTGPDVIVWVKMMAWELGGNFEAEYLRSRIAQSESIEEAHRFLDCYPFDGPNIIPVMPIQDFHGLSQGPDYTSTPLQEQTLEQLEQLNEINKKVRQLMSKGTCFPDSLGSNGWVVDGTMSTTGKPLLANDPHLGVDLPSTWYLAHLCAGDLDVMGATIPGVPGVAIGCNRHIAWGLTNLNPDVQDIFQERLSSDHEAVEFKGQIEATQLVVEIIKVKGQADIEHRVCITRHGPLMSDVIHSYKNKPPELGLALRWTGLEPTDTTVATYLEINVAHNWDQFKRALRHYVAPAQNFLYADVDGNIGYYAAGLVPIRAQGDGLLPAEGWSGRNEWIGWVPFEHLPHTYNPPEHFIVAANQRPVADPYPYMLGKEWATPYRALRIIEMLESKPKHSPADFVAMQGDTVSLVARQFLPRWLDWVNPQNNREKQAIDLLKAWNFDMAGDSAAAAIFGAWFRLFSRAIVESELKPDELKPSLLEVYEWRFQFVSRLMEQIFEAFSSALVARRPQIDCITVAGQTFRKSLQDLENRLGADINNWQWGKIHRLTIRHQVLGNIRLLTSLFSRSLASSGDWGTLNVGPFAYDPPFAQYTGAGYRQIVDLSEPEKSFFIQVTGQSGHFLSPHFDDYLPRWHSMHYCPMRFERRLVEQAQKTTLHLEPHFS